jgi:hypothetical protein
MRRGSQHPTTKRGGGSDARQWPGRGPWGDNRAAVA